MLPCSFVAPKSAYSSAILYLLASVASVCSTLALAQETHTEGQKISLEHCSRCHIVDSDKPFTGISSTPSFSLMVNALEDWEERFETFFARRPHPSFTRIEEIDNPLANQPSMKPLELRLEEIDNPLANQPSMKPIELRLEEVEKIVEFARSLKKAN